MEILADNNIGGKHFNLILLFKILLWFIDKKVLFFILFFAFWSDLNLIQINSIILITQFMSILQHFVTPILTSLYSFSSLFLFCRLSSSYVDLAAPMST